MHPVIATLRLGEVAVPIASYGVMLACALWVGGLGTLLAARRAGMELGAVISTLGLAIAGGFGGAVLTHALAQLVRAGSLQAFANAPSSLLGLSVLGALLGGTGALALCSRELGVSAAVLLDLAVPWVALAQAVGRIGCLLGGCCYGVASNGWLAVHYDEHAPGFASFARHPWPLYEAAALLLLALFFARLRDVHARPGARAASYLGLYALVRLTLEPLRGDAVRGVYFGGAISTAQILALLVLVCVLGFLCAPRTFQSSR